jgi:hypothetical protein
MNSLALMAALFLGEILPWYPRRTLLPLVWPTMASMNTSEIACQVKVVIYEFRAKADVAGRMPSSSHAAFIPSPIFMLNPCTRSVICDSEKALASICGKTRCPSSGRVAYLSKRSCSIGITGITLIKSVINSCFLRNIFNKHVFETYGVLTSHGIQKRYITACLTSKRKSISMNSSICLLNPELTRFITEFTEFPHEVSAQSKVKESKVKNNNMRTKLCATHISGGVDDFIKPNGHGPKEDKEDKEGSVQPYSFSEFWEFYDKKKDKQRAERAYKKISMRDRKCIFDTLQAYKDSTPNKKYRKNPEAYLNNRTWEDEIIPPDNDRCSKTPAQVLKVDVL